MRIYRPTDNPLTQDYSTAHKGYDFAGLNRPDAVYCGRDGEIIERVDEFTTNWTTTGKLTTRDYGNYIKVRHADGSFELHAHLKKGSSFVVGTKVKAGQVIARIGNTGNSTGPHLHSEYRNASNVNVTVEFYTNPTPPTHDPQSEIDKLREERDRNHKMFIGLCDIMQVEHNYDVAASELKKIITFEDRVLEKDKQLEEADKKIETLQADLNKLTEKNNSTLEDNKKLQEAVGHQEIQIEKQKISLNTIKIDLEKLRKICQPIHLSGWKLSLYKYLIN